MDKDPRTTRLGLASYLILPIQRIPRYRMLLAELIKQTEKSHPDYDNLNKALDSICQVADHLNTAMKGIDATNEIIKIQNQFTSEIGFIEPHRRFVMSGKFSELKDTDKVTFPGRDIYLHLFNDILVFSYPTNTGEYTFKGDLQLCNALLLDYVRNERSASEEAIFEIKAPTYQCILKAASVEEKNRWLNTLYKAINDSKSLRKNNTLNVTANAVSDETTSTLFVAKSGDLDDFELTPGECVQLMKQGATMLKFGRTGKPHFRTIVLSKNERFLLWSSPNKTTHESKVALTDVSKMEKGQKTAIFAKYRNPDHEQLSFSLLYKNRTLDLVCKDRKEYMIWITGIQYLLSNIIQGKGPSVVEDASAENVVVLSHDLNKERQKFKEMFERIGDAYTWGQGSRGALGHGDQQDQTQPLVMKDFLYLDVASVACENSASAAVMLTGELFTWGSGEKGRLGHEDSSDRLKPTLVKGLHGHKIMKVAMGALHTLALDENGHVWVFGSSEHGQLGLGAEFVGPTAVQNSPLMVPALKSVRVKDIACGHHHSACITLDGTVMIWGRGEDGQLGLSNKNNVPIPTVIPQMQGIKCHGLALGLWHSILLSDRGQLYSFGNATYGQLGHGTTDEQLQPKQIAYFESRNVIQVSAGSAHSACILDNGEIYCFGSGIYGQIGNNEKSHALLPTLVKSLRGDAGKEVACGVNHILALMDSGKVYSWGAGTYGRLGLKSENDQHIPKEITFLADKSVRMITAGGSQSACVCAHQWVPDKDATGCMQCKSVFTFMKRRHHCRYCGGIFCGSCTMKKKAILRFGFDDPVRVCDYCFSILSNNQ
jgi:alpha-tubulin suppressor-like RCC1 family protein